MAYHICVVGSAFDDGHFASIRNAAEENHCSVSFYPDADAAMPCLADCDILFAPSDARSPALVREAVSLKWFASYFAGVDPLLQPGVLRKDILLTNGSGAYGITIAEHMIMVSLMLLRRMPEYEVLVKNREFRSDLRIGSLYGANVVICGTGDIGQSFAQRLRAFCPARITGVNRSGRNVRGFDSVIPAERLDEVLPQADVLALALPGTKHTDGLISAQRIAAMKKTAILLNVGRGSCIDQDALIEALNGGQIAGAALDVFRTEPIPQDDPAWNTRNLLITPHCSGKMTMCRTRDILVNTFCENLKRFCEGSPMLHVVDTELGY